MANLSPTELETLRRMYIRDQAILPSGSIPASYLSRFNMAHKANYFTDTDLQELHARVLALYGGKLAAYWDDRYEDNLDEGDSDAQAKSDADAAEQHVRFGLVRAEAWTLQIADPAFRASLMVGDNSGSMTALLSAWQKQIDEDYATLVSSESGVISVPLERR